MMGNETKLVQKGLFILLLCITIIFCDGFYKLLNARTVNNIVINEVVCFEEFNNDRVVPFLIKEVGELEVETKVNVQSGNISIYIMDPDYKVIHSISGPKSEEDKVIDVYKGTWYYRVLCENSLHGSYSIIGELK